MKSGCSSSNIRRVSDETDFVVLGDICEKIQVLRLENVLLKHYTVPRTLKKKLEGTLLITVCAVRVAQYKCTN